MKILKTLAIVLAATVLLPTLYAQVTRTAPSHVPIRPEIPKAPRGRGDQVILERAASLERKPGQDYMVVTGDVKFSKGPMLMFCDSAHYYQDRGSMDAFGNVRMEQGDTLFVYADELNYDGPAEIAYLYSYDRQERPVRLINRDVKLETDIFTYDLYRELGFFNTRGILTDSRNRLEAIEGEYTPATKEANFYTDVHLNSRDDRDTLDIFTDTLYYNTTNHQAEFYSPTRIVNAQGVINSTQGTYNTRTEYAQLFSHSRVVTRRGTTLQGDTLVYDRQLGRGEAFGNMTLEDSVRQTMLTGDYGYYDEVVDSAFVTGRARAMEYSRGDTLYMHGRYITSVLRVDTLTRPNVVDSLPPVAYADTTHIVSAWPRVRFYRSDMQGISDSIAFVQRDSTLYMHRHPVVWSEERQIFGNQINVHLNDSTVDRAYLPDGAFTAQCLEAPDYYNQLSGKEMTAWFDGGQLRQLDVSGNVEAIFYPEENDSTINKMVTVESSFLTAWLKDQKMERLKMWPETKGTATPLYLARRSMLWLPKFEWFGDLRPTSPDDIFNIPDQMEQIMSTAPGGKPIDQVPDPRKAGQATETDSDGKAAKADSDSQAPQSHSDGPAPEATPEKQAIEQESPQTV